MEIHDPTPFPSLSLKFPDPLLDEALQKAPDRQPALVYLEGLAAGGGRKTMRSALNQAARLLSNGRDDALTLRWQDLRYSQVNDLRTQLEQRFQPATVNKVLSAVRGCLKAAWRMELMTVEDYHKAVDVPNVRGSRLPAGRALVKAEVAALLQVCREDPKAVGARDGAALALMAGAGLRRAETVAVRIEDYDAGNGAIRIVGKGHKERMAYLGGEASGIIAGWIRVRGSQPGPLLCPIAPSGRIEIRPLTGQAVMLRLWERCRQAGIRPCSPQDLRRTYISYLLEDGADLAVAQRMAGHANPRTTVRYDRREGSANRRTASRLDKLLAPVPARQKNPAT